MKFLFSLSLFLLLFVSFGRTQTTEPPNDDYFSIGAHLNADAFGKQLRKWLDNRLAVDYFKELLNQQQWTASIFGLKQLQNLSLSVDSRLESAKSRLSSLVRPVSSSIVSCHSIHELVRLPSSSPCAIRVSNTGVQPKYELKPVNDPLLPRQFLLSEDILFEFPAEFLPPRIHSGPIISTLLPYRKSVLLVIDIGSISTQDQLDTVRLVTNQLLDVASPKDSYSVFAAKGKDLTRIGCNLKTRSISRWTLLETKAVVDEIGIQESPLPTDHAEVLEKTVEEADEGGDPTVVMYISRGLLEDLEQAGSTVRRLSSARRNLTHPLKINTLLLVDERRSVPVWSSQFMENIAKYSRGEGEKGNFIEGQALKIEKNVLLDVNIVEDLLWIPFEDDKIEKLSISPPLSGNRYLTISRIISVNGTRSIVGTEVSLWILMAEVFQHNDIRGSDLIVHLLTIEGMIMVSSVGWEDVLLSSVDDWHPSSKWLLKDWEAADAGDFEVRRRSDNRTLFYIWAKLSSAPFVLVIRSERPFPQKRSSISSLHHSPFSFKHLVWHETVKETSTVCSNFGTPVLPGAASLFFPSSVSKNPQENPANHWVYLTDRIGLIHSSGLRSGIREQVALLNSLVDIWVKNSHIEGAGVLTRFAATPQGVLVVFPGTVVAKNYDPSKQQWFVEASKRPNAISIGGPVVSHHLGDVVTVSIAVTNNASEVVAVLGLEMTSSFLGKLLSDSVPSCLHSRNCLLFSPQGTVFYSDKAYTVSEVVERFHISHLEPLLTTDMTTNQRLVKKTLCRQGMATRRQFIWNTRYTRVHTTPCGDVRRGGSVASEVLVVPGTQIVLSMINATCQRTPVTVFCPCSVHDGRCLFCGRFDSLECECPCTCPGCVDERVPICEASPREDRMSALTATGDTPLCSKTDCSSLLHRDACVSVSGCEWCRFSSLLQPLAHSRCTSASVCYHGVLGRSSSNSGETLPHPGWMSPAPIGPIAAGAMVLLFILIGFVYCFRTHLTRAVLTRRGTAVDSAPLFGGTIETECDPTVFKEERVPVQLAFFEREAAARRSPPPPSDHGYSTMTDRNEETTSAVSTSLTDQPSSIVSSKRILRVDPLPSSLAPPPMTTSLVTMAEVHEEPRQGMMIC